MATIAITGATGFLGRRCAELLRADGHAVRALGRSPAVLRELEAEGFRTVKGDLAEQDMLCRTFDGCEAVVHCAALSSPWGSPAAFHESNVLGTQGVVDACRVAGVRRLVHISTPSIYMDRRDRLDISEGDVLPRRFINEYARTKHLAECLVRESALDSIILRPQGIFGPRDTAILPRLLKLGHRGVLPCFGDGSQLIDLTYVDNVVEAVRLAIRAPAAARGRAYNITNGEPVNQLEVIERLLQRLGLSVRRKSLPFWPLHKAALLIECWQKVVDPDVEPGVTAYGLCALAYSRTLCIDAARRDLGYTPRVPMEQGLDLLVEWATKNGIH